MGDAKVVPTKPSTCPRSASGGARSPPSPPRQARKEEGDAPPPKPPLTYQYHVGKGNNSRLILQALRKRPWFVPKNDSSSSASLSGDVSQSEAV